jgi:hypothetical protein
MSNNQNQFSSSDIGGSGGGLFFNPDSKLNQFGGKSNSI